jgi:hypothetical protein
MNKLFISAVLAMSFIAMPVAAQQTTMTKTEIKAAMKAEKAQKKKREKETSSNSTPVVVPAPVVTPTPVVIPAPVVTPAPVQPALTPYMQAQINAALARPPSFNCTYCAAFAASQGDLETVAAIGAGTYMQTTAPAAAPVVESAPVNTAPAPAQDTQATTTSESAPTEPAAVTQ